MEIVFNNKWKLWYHHNKKAWNISDYKMIYTISNIQDYWDFHNNLNIFNGIISQHFFLMKDDIKPIWEDPLNKKGGCWSIKISIEKSTDLWIKLSLYILGQTFLTNNNDMINGISISTKNNNYTIIKIWNNNNKINSIKLLPKDILNEFGFNIIYKSHIPEY